MLARGEVAKFVRASPWRQSACGRVCGSGARRACYAFRGLCGGFLSSRTVIAAGSEHVLVYHERGAPEGEDFWGTQLVSEASYEGKNVVIEFTAQMLSRRD